MKKVMKLLVFKILFVALVIGVLRFTPVWNKILSSGEYKKVDFNTLVLTPKPNQYLVCPTGFCPSAKAHKDSPVYPVTVTKLMEAFEQVIDVEKGVGEMVRFDETADFVVRTPMIAWPDRVAVRFISVGENESTLAIYSRSIFGRSDFGANKTRTLNWLSEIEKQLGS